MSKSQANIHWENRKLCIDESCIGVIGPDGRCKECGKKFEGEKNEERKTQPEVDIEKEELIEAEKNKSESQANIDWENRKLCIDESCIGVIGPDGRCKECGKMYNGY